VFEHSVIIFASHLVGYRSASKISLGVNSFSYHTLQVQASHEKSLHVSFVLLWALWPGDVL